MDDYFAYFTWHCNKCLQLAFFETKENEKKKKKLQLAYTYCCSTCCLQACVVF